MPLPVISKAHRLTRREASAYLRDEWGVRRTFGTLANLAISGGGPEFQRDGTRALYTVGSLDTWAAKQLTPPAKSTAELRELTARAKAPPGDDRSGAYLFDDTVNLSAHDDPPYKPPGV